MTEPERSNLEPLPVAALRGVSHRYGDSTALENIDLALAPGAVTALLGPNGAGKTTAIKLILGLLKPSQGQVSLYGGDPNADSSRIRVGTMMQVSGVPETLKVREHIELFRTYYPSPMATSELICVAGLDDVEQRLYGKLSGGQQQRLLFALAICGNPDLLILDEPTASLDVEARRSLWEAIRVLVESGKTVLLTTHYLEEADALADRVVLLDRGRIVADGTPEEIKSRASARRIRCRSSLTLEQVSALAGVRSVRQDRGSLEVLASAPEDVVRQLLARDAELADLEVAGAGLEEAFLHLTGRTAAERSGGQEAA